MEMFLNIGKCIIITNKYYYNFLFYYNREQLQANIQKNINKLEIDFEDLDSENKNLSDAVIHKPGTVIPLVSK